MKSDPDKITHILMYMWTLKPKPKASKKATEKFGILPYMHCLKLTRVPQSILAPHCCLLYVKGIHQGVYSL